jgi:hypothetical protein
VGIKLRIIPAEGAFSKSEVGDMWRTPENDHKLADGTMRECWFIRLPGQWNFWYTTANPTGQDGWNGWDVQGEAPNITVNPSINIPGEQGWHGWIRNGELVDA